MKKIFILIFALLLSCGSSSKKTSDTQSEDKQEATANCDTLPVETPKNTTNDDSPKEPKSELVSSITKISLKIDDNESTMYENIDTGMSSIKKIPLDIDDSISYKSSKQKVISVSEYNGELTPEGVGEAKITASFELGDSVPIPYSIDYTIKVSEIPQEKEQPDSQDKANNTFTIVIIILMLILIVYLILRIRKQSKDDKENKEKYKSLENEKKELEEKNKELDKTNKELEEKNSELEDENPLQNNYRKDEIESNSQTTVDEHTSVPGNKLYAKTIEDGYFKFTDGNPTDDTIFELTIADNKKGKFTIYEQAKERVKVRQALLDGCEAQGSGENLKVEDGEVTEENGKWKVITKAKVTFY